MKPLDRNIIYAIEKTLHLDFHFQLQVSGKMSLIVSRSIISHVGAYNIFVPKFRELCNRSQK